MIQQLFLDNRRSSSTDRLPVPSEQDVTSRDIQLKKIAHATFGL